MKLKRLIKKTKQVISSEEAERIKKAYEEKGGFCAYSQYGIDQEERFSVILFAEECELISLVKMKDCYKIRFYRTAIPKKVQRVLDLIKCAMGETKINLIDLAKEDKNEQ